MRTETRCAICKEKIDKSACGQAFTIITINDDRANSTNLFKRLRLHLCDGCTADFQLWLAENEVNRFTKEQPPQGVHPVLQPIKDLDKKEENQQLGRNHNLG